MEEGFFGIGLILFCFGLAYIIVVCYILNWQSYKKYDFPDTPTQNFFFGLVRLFLFFTESAPRPIQSISGDIPLLSVCCISVVVLSSSHGSKAFRGYNSSNTFQK